MSKNLRSIVDNLKQVLKPKTVPYGIIYDAIREMEVKTCAKLPGQTDDEWEEAFIQRNGTRQAFIEERTK